MGGSLCLQTWSLHLSMRKESKAQKVLAWLVKPSAIAGIIVLTVGLGKYFVNQIENGFMDTRDRIEQYHVEQVLALSKRNRARIQTILRANTELKREAIKATRAADEYRALAQKSNERLDSLLAAHPLADAPEECRPYTDAITECMRQVTELQVADSLTRAALDVTIDRADSLELGLLASDAVNDSLVNVAKQYEARLKPDKFLGIIPMPSRTTSFILGAIITFLGLKL